MDIGAERESVRFLLPFDELEEMRCIMGAVREGAGEPMLSEDVDDRTVSCFESSGFKELWDLSVDLSLAFPLSECSGCKRRQRTKTLADIRWKLRKP
jgi:hypothetical protein